MTTITESRSDKSLGLGGCMQVMWKYCHFIDRLECTGFCYSGRVLVGEVPRTARDECVFRSRLVRLTAAGIDYGSLCTGHPSSQRLIQSALCSRHLSLTCSADDRYLKWKHMGEERDPPPCSSCSLGRQDRQKLEDSGGVSRAKRERRTQPYPGTFSLQVLQIIWIKYHWWMYSLHSH